MKRENNHGAVIVLGMHRSGTSLITRAFQSFGFAFPDNLTPANKFNKKGYWESQDVIDFNNHVLNEVKLKWNTISQPLSDLDIEKIQKKFHVPLLSLLKKECPAGAPIVLKDPRISILLPLWKPALEEFFGKVGYLVAFRNPLEVAASLYRRDGLPQVYGLLLWLIYNVESLRNIAPKERIILDYNRAVANWQGSIEKIADFLDIPLASLSTKNKKNLLTQVDPNLQTHSAENKIIENSLVSSLYAAMQEFQDQQAKLSEEAESIAAKISRFSPDYGRMLWQINGGHLKAVTEERILSKIYLDTGAGFSEEESLDQAISCYDEESIFEISTEEIIAQVRFDVCEDYSKVEFHGAFSVNSKGTEKELTLLSSSAVDKNANQYLFSSQDPFFIFSCGHKVKKLIFRYSILGIGTKYSRELVSPLLVKIQDTHTNLVKSRKEIGKLNEKIAQLESEAAEAENKQETIPFLLPSEKQYSEGRVDYYKSKLDGITRSCAWPLARNLIVTIEGSPFLREALRIISNFRARKRFRKINQHPSPAGTDLFSRIRHRISIRKEIRLIKRSGLFDHEYYLKSYPDVASSRKNPLVHFASCGWREGRNPNQHFSVVEYLKARPDVAQVGVNPFAHFIRNGRFEHTFNYSLNSSSSEAIYTRQEFELETPPVEMADDIKLIAFYLPQFHPIPENDEWWGPGFTEWQNVVRALPEYPGHHQPRLPSAMGYYDLRNPETQLKQIEIAMRNGIHGFCYYYYWFNGRRLLEKPLETFLEHPEWGHNFCVCWANENWTRTWDGLDREVLISQEHNEESDVAFIKDTADLFKDKRYIRINGKPLLIIYRPDLLPQPKNTAELWRQYCRDIGFGEIYLAMVQTHFGKTDPPSIGYDAAIEFPPHKVWCSEIMSRIPDLNQDFTGKIYDYHEMMENALKSPAPKYKLFRGLMPSWDNSARRPGRGHIFRGSSPDLYQRWLEGLITHTRSILPESERFLFINAWNEWAEGTYLEPDSHYGYAYLNRTKSALAKNGTQIPKPERKTPRLLPGSKNHISKNRSHHFEKDYNYNNLDDLIKCIAFYLPQFHPVPENDEWWGEGFTEWTNVSRALPRYQGHYQPRMPGELGHYDLRVREVQHRQVELARQYGIHGFCFYYYWFCGKRLLEKPIDDFLNDDIDFPFCLCWANESWSRRWDGSEDQVLLSQNHSPESDENFIKAIEPFLLDKRYIRFNGKPVLLVYRPDILPEAKETARRWRSYWREQGHGELYLCIVQTFGSFDPRAFGFDAAVEFPPHSVECQNIKGEFPGADIGSVGKIFDYREMKKLCLKKKSNGYQVFRGLMSAWDNSARKDDPYIWAYSSPAEYQEWLEDLVDQARNKSEAERFIFINAWNEWAEGTYLEPDQHYGYSYLNATARALKNPEINKGKAEPLISVVLPLYNGEVHLRETLRSVWQQTFRNFEIVVIDDGSADSSARIVKEFAAKHPTLNLTYIYQKNQGAHAAINNGVKAAKGEFIAVINHDDLFHPARLEVILKKMEQENSEIAFSHVGFIDKNSQPIDNEFSRDLLAKVKASSDFPNLQQALFCSNVAISTGNFIFTKELFEKIGGFSDLKYCHDWNFLLKALFFTEPLSLKETLYLYRDHATNAFKGLEEIAHQESELVLGNIYANLLKKPESIERIFGSKKKMKQFIKEKGQTHFYNVAQRILKGESLNDSAQ